MASQGAPQERNQDATLYVGDLDTLVTEELLWELFVQCGPVTHVHIPHDRVLGGHNGYGFVEFRNEDDVDYAQKLMNGVALYGKPIRVNKASQGKKAQDVGANLFVGGLAPDVDENILEQTFRLFGTLIQTPKIMRDETGASRGFGFVNFDSFEASDAAIQGMHQQWLGGRQINVTYAFKKDNKNERHGDAAERRLAALSAQNRGDKKQTTSAPDVAQARAMIPMLQQGPPPSMPPPGGYGTGANMAPLPMRPNLGAGPGMGMGMGMGPGMGMGMGPPNGFPPPPGGYGRPGGPGGHAPRPGFPPPPGGIAPMSHGLPPPPGGFAAPGVPTPFPRGPPGGFPPPPGGFHAQQQQQQQQ